MTRLLIAPLVVLVLVRAAGAEDRPPTGDSSIVPDGAKLERVWNEGAFTEGVAVAPDGSLYFSDIPFDEKTPGRVLRFDPETGKTTVVCADSGKSNGLMFDADGRLIACCGAMGGARALARITEEGQVKILVDRYEGKRLNSPNDLVIHPRGWIYFSDPRYAGDEPLELDHMSVYRYDRDGTLHRATRDIRKPNGVIISPDGRTLYVAETDNGSTEVRREDRAAQQVRMTLNAFPIGEDGTLGQKRVLVDFGHKTGIDGMTVDQKGNLYAAVRSEDRFGIVVYTPDGKELAYIPTPELPTNCCFGSGDEARTLYITAGKGLYRIRLGQSGYHPMRKP